MTTHHITTNDVRRFYDKIVPGEGGCWLWQGHLSSDKGNGRRQPQFYLPPHKVYARRVAYQMVFGEVPRNLKWRCEHPLCVSPLHAVQVPKTTVLQASTKPRQPWSARTARRVVALSNACLSQPDIARRLGVNQSLVCIILKMARYCREGQLVTRSKQEA